MKCGCISLNKKTPSTRKKGGDMSFFFILVMNVSFHLYSIR